MSWRVWIFAPAAAVMVCWLGWIRPAVIGLSTEAAQPPMLTKACIVPGTYEARTLANGWVVSFVANNGYRAEHIAPDLRSLEAEMTGMCEEAANRGK